MAKTPAFRRGLFIRRRCCIKKCKGYVASEHRLGVPPTVLSHNYRHLEQVSIRGDDRYVHGKARERGR